MHEINKWKEQYQILLIFSRKYISMWQFLLKIKLLILLEW